jgi:hypothetical protein
VSVVSSLHSAGPLTVFLLSYYCVDVVSYLLYETTHGITMLVNNRDLYEGRENDMQRRGGRHGAAVEPEDRPMQARLHTGR